MEKSAASRVERRERQRERRRIARGSDVPLRIAAVC